MRSPDSFLGSSNVRGSFERTLFLNGLTEGSRSRLALILGSVLSSACIEQGLNSVDRERDSVPAAPIVSGEPAGAVQFFAETFKSNEGPPAELREFFDMSVYSPHHQFASSFTFFCLATALTGKDIIQLDPETTAGTIETLTMSEADQAWTTANLLHAQGFATAIFYGNAYLGPDHGITASGFDVVQNYGDSIEETQAMLRDAGAFIEQRREEGQRYYVVIFPYLPHDPYNQIGRQEDAEAADLALGTTSCPWDPRDMEFSSHMNSEFSSLSNSEQADCLGVGGQFYGFEHHTLTDQIVRFFDALRERNIAFHADGDTVVDFQADHGECLAREDGTLQMGAGEVTEATGKWGHGYSVSWCETEGYYAVWIPGQTPYEVAGRTSQKDTQCTALAALGLECPGEGHTIVDLEAHGSEVVRSFYCNRDKGHALSVRGDEVGNDDLIYRNYAPLEGRDGNTVTELVRLSDPYTLLTEPVPAELQEAMDESAATGLTHCIR